MKSITKRSLSVILVLMTVISIFGIVPITASAANPNEFTASVDNPGAPLDSTGTTRHYTVTTQEEGTLDAICIYPCRGIPTGERTWKRTYSASDKAENLNRQMLRKILYYGYLGPGANLTIKSADGKTEKTADQWIKEAINSNDSVQNAQHEALAWWYRAEYDWQDNWNNEIYKQSTYHDDGTMWKWHEDIYNYIKTINWFPPAPPVEIFRSTGGKGQDLIAWKFYVHYLVEKDSTNSTVEPSMNGIKYKITDSGDTSWSTNIHLNYDHRSNANQPNDGRYNFENTNAGVYVNASSSYEGFLENSNDSFAGKTAGSKRIQKGVARAVEYETNNAYAKSETEYQMIYTGRKTTDGYGVLVPWNNTFQKQWPTDTPNAVYQIKKTSSATNQGVEITGAVYAIFTNKEAADNANSKTYASAQAAKDAAPNGWIQIDKDGYGGWGDGNGKNPSDDEAVYRNKNSGKPRAITQTYYAREIWAPSGYDIDKTTYEFKFSGKVDTNGVPIFRPTVASTDVLNIKLQAAKISSKPNVTNENAAYSYAGAEFTVYYKDGNEYKEFKPEGSVIKLTTDKDEDGYAKYGTDPQGATNNKASDYAPFKNKNSGKPIPMEEDVDLYIKETKAPKGYVATDTYYKLVKQNLTDSKGYYIYRASDKTAVNPTAAAGKDSQKISNAPEFDPWSLKLTKTASSGSTATPLSDAIFRITYYDYVPTQNNDIDRKDGQNVPIKTELQQSKTKAKRIWYIKTSADEDNPNEYTAWLDDDHLVKEGTYKTKDSLYYDENKQPIIPMGLITVEEVKAPVGFKVKDWTWYIGVTQTTIQHVKTENEPIKLGISEDSDNGYIGVKKKDEAGNRVAGAKYGLYQTKYDADHNVNKVAELTTTLRSNVAGRTDGDIFLASGVPYQATVGKTYYIRETEVPQPTGDIIYLLDDHTYSVTVTEANATIESAVMIDSTDFTEDTPKGSLKVKKTSDDNNVEDIYFALVDSRGHEYKAKKVDADGYAQWDNLQIYERGNSGTKIKYTVKELGYGVTFQKGQTTYTNTQGEYEWTINQADCIEYPTGSKQYYEGVANPVYQTTWKTEKLYPKWYYRNKTEAQTNQNGKTTTLNNPNDTTEVTMLKFHNGIPRVKIKINKTGAGSRNQYCLFRVTDSKGNVYSSIGGICGIDGVLESEVEYSKVQNEPGFLLSCQEYPNSAVPIPMTYSVEEVGWYIYTHNSTSTLQEFGDAWAVPIISPAQTADVEKDDELLEFGCINTLSTYNFDITKSSEDGVVKDIWFEITGVITDEAVDTYPSRDDIITNETFAEYPEAWQEIIDQYGDGTYENPHADYAIGPNDELYPIIAWSKDGNEMKPVYRIMIKTDNNGKASTTANDIILYTVTRNTETGKEEFEELPDNKLYTGEGVKIDGIPNVSLEDYSSYVASYLMFTRIRELGEKQADGSFKFPERYIPTGDQYASGFIGNDLHYSFENHFIRGSAKLHKTNDNGEDVPNSIWTLSQKVGIDEQTQKEIYKLVELTKTVDPDTQKVTKYSYVNIADTDDVKTMIGDNEVYIDSRILVTNNAGDIEIDNLPPGEYKLIEIEPPQGYMPLGKELKFAVTPQNHTQTNVLEYEVTDAMSFLPNTGGHGPIAATAIAVMLAIPTAILAIMYHKKKKQRKLKG